MTMLVNFIASLTRPEAMLLAALVWAAFPLRMLLDRSMTVSERRSWALVCAIIPVAGYLIFLIVRAIRASFAARAA